MPECEEELDGTCDERIFVCLGRSSLVYSLCHGTVQVAYHLELGSSFPSLLLSAFQLFHSSFFLGMWAGRTKKGSQTFFLVRGFYSFFFSWWSLSNWLLWCLDILCSFDMYHTRAHTHTQLCLHQVWFIHTCSFTHFILSPGVSDSRRTLIYFHL